MKHAHNNDNEPNPWLAIGLQAALILNKLRCQSQLDDASEFSIKRYSSPLVSSGSFFNRVKCSEPFAFPIHSDGRSPPVGATLSPIDENALISGGGANLRVSEVEDSICHAQIANSVVGFVAIDVIKFMRHDAIDVKPCQSMGIESLAADKDTSVTERAKRASDMPNVTAGSTDKHASFRAVIQELPHLVSRDDFARGHQPSHLHEKKNEDRGGDGDASDADKKKNEDDRCYVEQRLREAAIWERRLGRKD